MGKKYEPLQDLEDVRGDSKFSTTKPRSWTEVHTVGWRFGVLSCTTSAILAFLVNLIVTLWTVGRYGVEADGRQVLYDGSCDTVRKLNVAVHLFINVMSTILLSSSNYCMQCLTAPTRREVDLVHQSEGLTRWLDIGVPSLRNLWWIDRRRFWLWFCLGASSVPLHLFYNSAVFTSIAAYQYPIVVANEKFITSLNNMTNITDFSYNYNEPSNMSYSNYSNYYPRAKNTTNITNYTAYIPQFYPSSDQLGSMAVNSSSWRLKQKASQGLLESLDKDACISAYAQDFVTSRGGLILVLDTPLDSENTSRPVLFDKASSWGSYQSCDYDRYSWICGQNGYSVCDSSMNSAGQDLHNQRCQAHVPQIKTNTSGWRPINPTYPVKSCLSERVPEQCKLQASFHIMVLVLFLNLAKVGIMCATVLGMKESPLMTVGDAIASFLTRPDPKTQGLSLLSNTDVSRYFAIPNKARQFEGTPRRWASAVSKTRWILCIAMYTIALAVCISLLVLGIISVGTADLRTLWSLGLGSINPLTFISWTIPSQGASGLIGNAFVANTPQIILSFIYFSYNSIFTCMSLGSEWQSYMKFRKGLRISNVPAGSQRSTYFLQLPYRFALPLMVVSGLLHWLVSQSIFLVDIETYVWDDSNGTYKNSDQLRNASYSVPDGNQITCGFSPIGILFVIVLGVAMLCTVIAIGRKRFKTGMPVASSNSIAISAACHPNSDEVDEGDTAYKLIQWGATGGVSDGVGHCSFSSKEVSAPQDGNLYA